VLKIAVQLFGVRSKGIYAFLNERSDKLNEKGKYPYKHRGVKSAVESIKRYYEYIFTYEKYPELNIEKITNRIEGLFKELKGKLRPHRGLTRKHKMLFIQDFLNKKAGKDHTK
ncbi:hypothetical protein P9081_11840, partial [Gallibacterium anatis]